MKSPDHGPSRSSSKEFDFGERDKLILPFLSPEGIAELRKKQNEIIEEGRAELGFAALDPDNVEAADKKSYKKFEALRNKYLEDFGIAADDPNRSHYEPFLDKFSVNNMNNQRWNVDASRGSGDPQSGREKAGKAYDQIVQNVYTMNEEWNKDHPPTPESEEEKAKKAEEEAKAKEKAEKAAERDKKIETLEKELGPLQHAKHAAFAARMAVGLFKRKKKAELDEAYQSASAKYHSTLKALELLKLEKQGEDLKEHGFLGSHEEEINGDLQKRFDTLLKGDNDAQHEELVKSGGWKAKLYERFANMSKGRKLALMAIGGVALAGTGFGLAVVAGGIGTVGAVAAGTGMGVAKSTKAYAVAKSRMYAKKDEGALDFKLEDTSVDPKQALEQALSFLRGEDEKDIKDADKQKKIAFAMGLGTAALGSGVGMWVSHGADWVSNRPSGWTGGKVGDMFAGPENVPTPSPEKAADLPKWSIDAMEAPKPALSPDMVPTDFNLRPGAGFYEEFGKIPGIDKQHYHDLWQAVGPKLAEMPNGYDQPLAYEMHGEPGNWGIRMTADGKMPKEAMDTIVNTYQEMFGGGVPAGTGGLENAADVASTPDAVTLTQADAAELQNVVKMDVINPDDVIAQHPALVDKLSHAAANVPAEQFAHHMALPDEVWLKNLQPYIVEQMRGGNDLYTNAFYQGPDNVVRFVNATIPKEAVADLLAQIPREVRESVTVS